METWDTHLFWPCAGEEAGVSCCVQQTFCLPCVWGKAIQLAGVKNATFLAALVCLGGDTCADEAAGYLARRQLVDKYNISELEAESFIVSCCCSGCARCQETNMVVKRESLKYECASVSQKKKKAGKKTKLKPVYPLTTNRA